MVGGAQGRFTFSQQGVLATTPSDTHVSVNVVTSTAETDVRDKRGSRLRLALSSLKLPVVCVTFTFTFIVPRVM